MIAFVRLSLLMLLVGASVYGGLALFWPRPQAVVPVQAAVRPANTHTPRPTVTPTSGPLLRLAPLIEPSETPVPATTTPEPTATLTASPTIIPSATAVPEVSIASFNVPDGGMRHNIKVALDANGGALRRVIIPPGTVFSFNDSLGPRANRLPWKPVGRIVQSQQMPSDEPFFAMRQTTATVGLGEFGRGTPVPPPASPEPTSAPPQEAPAQDVPPPAQDAPPPAEDMPVQDTPTPTQEPPQKVYVLGGGVCDLASRYVVAARRILPNQAFSFKRHTGGVAGVRIQDAVSIWTTDNGRNDNDLIITNTTDRWLVFEAYLDNGQVTVLAWLQDGP